ncbi:hypothetical protein VPNG_08751 [Cytospora leucostoma]|uniref:MARVEL domain-containing protein n=1 Tax=Cytospora leucostoma TaxID=1230097 RepID=A0A423VXT4_9PEZI|nr:hypothetical protein VPNG_08751 [Cytospora leucostoma]
MEFPVVLALRAVQGIFAIIIIGLSAYVVHWYNVDTLTSPPAQMEFLIFVPVFSLISIAYLETIPRFMPKFSHPWATLALEIINSVFYFAGFIAMAVFLNHLLYCRGAVCGSARASTVFAAFSFALWGATAGLAVRNLLGGGGLAGLSLGRRGAQKPGAQRKNAQMREVV